MGCCNEEVTLFCVFRTRFLMYRCTKRERWLLVVAGEWILKRPGHRGSFVLSLNEIFHISEIGRCMVVGNHKEVRMLD